MKIQNVSKSTFEVAEPALGFKTQVAPGEFLPDDAPEKVKNDMRACVMRDEAREIKPRWKIVGEKPKPAPKPTATSERSES